MRAARAFSVPVMLSVLILLGVMLSAGAPSPWVSPPAITPIRMVPLSIHVVDMLSKQPIAGAWVKVSGVARLVLTDAQGRATIAIPETLKMVNVSAEKGLYMGVTETRVALSSTPSLLVAMPPVNQLKQADAYIRDPQVLDPHRQQEVTPPLPAPNPPLGNRSILPINTPIAVTYPLPANIQVKKTDGSIISLPLEEYLKGVLPKEIGSSFPMEAMKAQAVAARTYTLQYTQGGKNPICTTTTCQVWGTTQYAATSAAVDATKGQVAVYTGSNATYKGQLAGGYFAASCGGYTINSEAKWSFRPYLRAVSCIENKKGLCSVSCKYTDCGGGQCPSSNTTCWGVFGHRIGLCQRGAEAMGKCGKSHVDIVTHYYTDSEIANMQASSQPVDDAKFVRETVPSGTSYNASQTFTKEWTLENIGTTTWSAPDYTLVRIDGTAFGAANSIAMGSAKIAPKQSHTFSIQMTAPTNAGTYTARWRLANKGKQFGPEVNISIVVKEKPPTCVDNDKDGFYAPAQGCPEPFDCDDNDPNVHPGAKEICGNGKDDDCKDGDAVCPPECVDNDKDGYFAPNDKCPGPYDCDDNDPNVNPGAKEICGNGKDDDCNGGDAVCPKDCVDKDGDGYGVGAGCPDPQDCDDNDPSVYPGAPEICGNGKDEDCRGGDSPCSPGNPADPLKKIGEGGCTKHSDCETGSVCVEYNNKQLCTIQCGSAGAFCPADYSCVQNAACWPTKDLPAGGNQTACRNGSDCQSGEMCESGQCIPKTKGGCAGCQTTQMPFNGLIWWLGLGVLLLCLRRRASSY